MNENFSVAPFGAVPNERQLNHFRIGKKAFFHFGVNTFTGSEWGDGSERELTFNPTDTNVRGWIRDIKAAGYGLAILTAKHHDGFCLWPSKYTKHSIKYSPYKNGEGDIVREFCDACREFNVKIGLYLSPWDRHSEYWGTPEYSNFYANQLTELVTEYGKLDEIWWDGAGSVGAKYDWGLWAYIVRKHQPDAVIFGSMGATPYAEMRWVGTEAGYAGSTHYASINREMMLTETVEHMNSGIIGGELYVPAEVDVSIRPGWFYHEEQDSMVKTSREIDEIWFRSVGNNAIMLLNFPPDRTGNICRTDVENAIESNQRINRMLAMNFIDRAEVSADSQYDTEHGICKAQLLDDSLFYVTAKDKDTAEILITLPEGAGEINTLILGEEVQLGERITEFTLESLDCNNPVKLYTGTSVGYLRAVRFDKGSYRHLRLTLKGITAPLTLRRLSLHCYEEDRSDPITSKEKINIAALPTAKTLISDDRKTAQILFGGIFPFDTISFKVSYYCGYKVYAFDGSKYYEIASGYTPEYRATIKLDKPITSSYQIKIECDNGFSIEPDFKVY